MKIPQIFLFAVGSSLPAISASAALPAFSQTINLPPLKLAENAKGNLQPFEKSEPAAPAPLIIPQRSVVRADKFTFSPPAGVDYKLLIKHPDPSVDYRMIVKETGPQSGK
jgi:hypothetical protein